MFSGTKVWHVCLAGVTAKRLVEHCAKAENMAVLSQPQEGRLVDCAYLAGGLLESLQPAHKEFPEEGIEVEVDRLQSISEWQAS